MGYIQYGTPRMQIAFDDRTLAHIQVVVMAKLRRGEGLFSSWIDDPELGNGRSSIWLNTGIPLYFHFGRGARHELNRDWLEILSLSANSAQGLTLVAEPAGNWKNHSRVWLPRNRGGSPPRRAKAGSRCQRGPSSALSTADPAECAGSDAQIVCDADSQFDTPPLGRRAACGHL